MTQLQQWKNHPTRRKEFSELLNGDETLHDAIGIVKEKLYEITFPPTGGTYSLTEFYALYGARMMGYQECLQNLLGLANISPHKVPDKKPWTTAMAAAAEGQPEKPQPK